MALQLSNERIIRLHISNLSTGCQLYGSYSKELEEGIRIWRSLDKKNAKSLAIEYALEWNTLKTKEEIDFHKKIVESNKYLPDEFLPG